MTSANGVAEAIIQIIIYSENARRAKHVWNLWIILCPALLNQSGDIPFSKWLDTNLKDTTVNTNNSHWNTTFAATVWNLWKMRNEFEFCNNILTPNQVIIKSTFLAKAITEAFNINKNQDRNSGNTLIKWVPPYVGTIKLNTEVSTSNNHGYASFGRVARSDQEKWIEGFCGFIGAASPLKAKLQALKQAMKMCKEKGWFGPPIETDCLEAVDLINKEEQEMNHPERIVMEECRTLKLELDTPVRHIPRNANRVADKVAKLGGAQNERTG